MRSISIFCPFLIQFSAALLIWHLGAEYLSKAFHDARDHAWMFQNHSRPDSADDLFSLFVSERVSQQYNTWISLEHDPLKRVKSGIRKEVTWTFRY